MKKMNKLIIALLLNGSMLFAQDVPYYNRGVDKPQDIGAINQNFRDLADRKDVLSDGDVPSDYQKCIFSPILCINQYDNTIKIDTSTVVTIGSLNITTINVSSFTTVNGNFNGTTSTTTFSGWIDIGIEIVADGAGTENDSAQCTTGKRLIGGGCYTASAVYTTYPETSTKWTCRTAVGQSIEAYAICARIK